MSWMLAAVLAMVAGVAIGRAYGAAHHAHAQFTSQFSRSRASLRSWIVMTVWSAVLIAGFGLILYTAYRLAIG